MVRVRVFAMFHASCIYFCSAKDVTQSLVHTNKCYSTEPYTVFIIACVNVNLFMSVKNSRKFSEPEQYKETWVTVEIRLCPTLTYYILYETGFFTLLTALGNPTWQATFGSILREVTEPETVPSIYHPPAQADGWLTSGGYKRNLPVSLWKRELKLSGCTDILKSCQGIQLWEFARHTRPEVGVTPFPDHIKRWIANIETWPHNIW